MFNQVEFDRFQAIFPRPYDYGEVTFSPRSRYEKRVHSWKSQHNYISAASQRFVG